MLKLTKKLTQIFLEEVPSGAFLTINNTRAEDIVKDSLRPPPPTEIPKIKYERT